MIKVKSEREIELIKKSASILVEVRKILKDKIAPGVKLITLDKLAEKEIKKRNALPAFKNYDSFPATLCLSVNETIVHGIPTNYKLKDGDILTIDMGVNYEGYYSDSARTYPVGKVSTEKLDLINRTKLAFYKGCEKVKNNVFVSEISKAIENYLKPFGYGIVKEFTGHGIGKDLHEDPYIPNYYSGKQNDLLVKNMVICIEPMVNLGVSDIIIPNNNFNVITKDKKVSAHYEDMVLVLEDGYEILTKDLE